MCLHVYVHEHTYLRLNRFALEISAQTLARGISSACQEQIGSDPALLAARVDHNVRLPRGVAKARAVMLDVTFGVDGLHDGDVGFSTANHYSSILGVAAFSVECSVRSALHVFLEYAHVSVSNTMLAHKTNVHCV